MSAPQPVASGWVGPHERALAPHQVGGWVPVGAHSAEPGWPPGKSAKSWISRSSAQRRAVTEKNLHRLKHLTLFPRREIRRAPETSPQLESDLWSSRDRAEPTRIHLLHLLRGPGAARADRSTNFLGSSFTARESLGEAEVN